MPKNLLSFGEIIRDLREKQDLPLRKIAAELDIDQSVLSKIERGERHATREQVKKISRIFKVNQDELMINYLADRLVYEVENEDLALKAILVAEEKIKYLVKHK